MTKTYKKRKKPAATKTNGIFTLVKARRVLDAVSNGTTVTDITKELGIPRTSVYRWLKDKEAGKTFKWQGEDADFEKHFARAKEMGFDAIAEETLTIADTKDESVCYESGENDKGPYSKTKTFDSVEHRKLRIWTRLQLLAKWSNRYSDKQKVELTGKDGGAIQSETKVVESMSTEELMRIAQMQTNEQGIDTGS